MGLFEVARWKKSLTANVRLSCDVKSMAMLVRFESSWTGVSHQLYPTLRTHLSCGAGTVARSGCSFTLSHAHIRKHLKRHTNAHFVPLSHPLPSCLSISLFYTSVTSAFLLCSLCQFPFHATSRKSVQVNISRLLMLKGSDSGRYVTGRELPVPGAATDKTRTIVFPRCFYLIKQQIWVIGRWHFTLHLHYSSSFSERTPAAQGKTKHWL